MNIKKIIILCGLIFFTEISTTAQKVAKETINSYTYYTIDCISLPVKSRRLSSYASGAAPSHTEQDDWNRLPYRKMAISPSDNSTATTFANAVSICNSYLGPSNSEGGKWRLPNQREIILIGIVYKRLIAQSGFSSCSDSYWSSTKVYNSTEILIHTISTGFLDYAYSRNHKVRCVREFE